MNEQIKLFFTSKNYGVVGASINKEKFGNKVLCCYIKNKKPVVPVNPVESVIEGLACVKHVADLPDDAKSISVITPPASTSKIVDEAIRKGITSIWMQPGAQSDLAVQKCKEHGINVIADGHCILVELGCN